MALACRLVLLFTVLGSRLFAFAAEQHPTDTWATVTTPFHAVNLTAVGGAIWVSGADEMIITSKDGGATWETKHQNRDGEVLLNISFVNEKIGYAAGTGGVLLSTVDGGDTWKRYGLNGPVRSFSFADAANGLAVVADKAPTSGLPPGTTSIVGTVKITHDGGEHWENIAALESDELRPFVEVLSVAALDSSHYLMLRRKPGVEDAFVITGDGGKSWKLVHMQNDASNRVLARTVFAHQGEYWAFGMELVHREKGGGYGVPLAIHSKDGENWLHGAHGPNEFEACNSQGCYLWDGSVDSLYGEHEQYWNLPRDGSLSDKWALAGNTACTVSGTLKCASATLVDKPQPRAEEGVIFTSASSGSFADGCLECAVQPIVPDSPGKVSMNRVHASMAVRRDGTVANVSVDYPASKRVSGIIAEQLSKWLFEPAHSGQGTVETKKDASMILMCSGFPGQPETDGCSLHPLAEFARP